MTVITHTVSLNGNDRTNLRIGVGHVLPDHVAYLGVLHGEHEALCDCDACLDEDGYELDGED